MVHTSWILGNNFVSKFKPITKNVNLLFDVKIPMYTQWNWVYRVFKVCKVIATLPTYVE